MKIAKILRTIFCFCVVAFTAVSCDDFLDITPDGQVKRDELLSTAEGIEDAMYGVYSQLRSTSLYGQELYFSALEVMAHNLYCDGNTTTDPLGKFEYTNTNVKGIFENVWVEMYKNISNANSVLNSSPVADATEFPYKIYRGEALGLRAFMHFDLVRLFTEQYTQNPDAEGIPYATDFSLKTPPFESLQKNYEHIIADLKMAETCLENESEYENTSAFMNDRQTHFNIYAVWGTLARVYFTMGNNEQAVIYAKKAIGGKHTLKEKTEVENDMAGVLSKKECLFGVYHSGFYTNVYAKLQQTTTRYSLDLRSDYLSVYESESSGVDFRTTAYFSSVTIGDQSRDRLSKFTDIYELQNIASSRPVELILGINLIRVPEMYYILAEALLESDYETALSYYNEVRLHRGLEKLKEDVILNIDLINEERYKEYIGEGQIFYNMKRLNLPIVSYDGTTTYQPGKGIYVVPIPDSEIENRY